MTFDVHSPQCDAPTGKTGRVRSQCSHGIIDRDASVCGAIKPCLLHGGEFPDENDVPIEVRRALMDASVASHVDYYWLCAIYRRGFTDGAAGPSPAPKE
jgi:hypothetical protein